MLVDYKLDGSNFLFLHKLSKTTYHGLGCLIKLKFFTKSPQEYTRALPAPTILLRTRILLNSNSIFFRRLHHLLLIAFPKWPIAAFRASFQGSNCSEILVKLITILVGSLRSKYQIRVVIIHKLKMTLM
jgi:hypothetical protein